VTPDNPNNPDVLTNTASSYVPIINIDNADKYSGNYAFQLLVYTTSYSTGYRQARNDENQPLYFRYVDGILVLDPDPNWGPPYCEAYNVPHEQILSNVVQDPNAENPFVQNPFVQNPFVQNYGAENPFVQNPFVQNPFVQNSAFAMAPPEGPTDTGTSGFTKVAAYPDGTTKDDRAPNSIKLTLRAFQLKPFCDVDYNEGNCIDRSYEGYVGTELEYDPNIDLPSAAVGSWPCIMGSQSESDGYEQPAECFSASAADLVPLNSTGDDFLNPSVPDASARAAFPAGTEITFPLGDWNGTWLLKNQADHPDAYAAAENGDLTQGYYLCPKDYVDGYPKNLPLDVSLCTEPLYQDPTPTDNTMSPGEAIAISPAPSLGIPHDLEPGLYYLTVYADDQVEISELNDVNNTAYFLIEVLDPDWDLVGPLQPWYEGYPVGADSSVPIKWYYELGGQKVESYSPDLEIRVKGPFTCGEGEPDDALETVEDAGSSDLRYKWDTDEWHFNWDTVGLADGCYNLRIYQPITDQEHGPFGFVLD
jgi:hypothetical protein